jgi:hypothetical protein
MAAALKYTRPEDADRSLPPLTVSEHRLGVASLPGSLGRTTDGSVGTVSLDAESSVLAAGGGQTPSLAVLHDGLADPVDTGIVADDHMGRITQDNFVIFVSGVLVDPVRVEHSEVAALSADTLLSDTAKVSGKFKLIDTLVLGLSVHNSLMVRPLAATSAHGNAVDHESLLSLISELVGLVSSGGSVNTDNLLVLTVFPGSHTKQKAHDITLLLSPHLLKIFVCTHFPVAVP